MCGRYAITSPPEAIARLFALGGPLLNLRPRYNAAPGQDLPIIRRQAKGERELTLARWGLIPSWSKGPDSRFPMINARSDTVASKPAYRGPFRHKRCLVPADGYFEWQTTDHGKQPYYISDKRGLMAFAGLWDCWLSPEGDEVVSFTIIVTDAISAVSHIHPRMPVILPPEKFAPWLGETDDSAAVREVEALLAGPKEALPVQFWPVSRDVNRPTNDIPDVLLAVEPPGPAQEQGSLL
jgi:putative SOS response-associated peptidase YedK